MKGHPLQPSVFWKKALQQTEPSSSLSSWLALAVVVAQSTLAVLALAQSVQAVPGLVHSPLVSAQKVHGDVHDVHRVAQIFRNAYAQISHFWTLISWKR